MALYGHEIDETIDPLTAGLDFAVSLEKGGDGFIGQQALREIAASSDRRRLVGLRLEGRRAARQGMQVLAGSGTVGAVTSGCLSPTLDASIAMAIVEQASSNEGTTLQVDLGRQVVEATVVPMPFYSR